MEPNRQLASQALLISKECLERHLSKVFRYKDWKGSTLRDLIDHLGPGNVSRLLHRATSHSPPLSVPVPNMAEIMEAYGVWLKEYVEDEQDEVKETMLLQSQLDVETMTADMRACFWILIAAHS